MASSLLTGPADVDAEAAGGYGPSRRSPWLDVDWRAHQRWIPLAGYPVNVIEMGAGDPLLFVHGLGGSWRNWLEQIPVFARCHRTIALDLPGFGASPMPAERISITGYARMLDELCRELGIERAAVVGNSMGGFIAAELAIQFPRRVAKLVLVSAAGLSIEHQRREPLITLARRLAYIAGWVAGHSDTLTRRPRARQALMAAVVRHGDRLPAPLTAEQVRGAGKPGFVDALDAITSYPIQDRIPEIRCPTLIVWGRQDRLVPVRDAYEFEALIPHARKVIFEDTGHVPQLERPDAFNRVVAEFLAS